MHVGIKPPQKISTIANLVQTATSKKETETVDNIASNAQKAATNATISKTKKKEKLYVTTTNVNIDFTLVNQQTEELRSPVQNVHYQILSVPLAQKTTLKNVNIVSELITLTSQTNVSLVDKIATVASPIRIAMAAIKDIAITLFLLQGKKTV